MKETPRHPWLSIWTRPRATIAEIVASHPNRSLWVLAAIYGFSSLMNLFQSGSLGSKMGVVPILILAVVFSPLWGYVAFSFWSWFVSWTGKWFKGKGPYTHIRAAYAWSCVPMVFQIPLWLFLVAVFGRKLFTAFPEGAALGPSEASLLFFLLIGKVVLAVWSLVIYVNALAEVQKFSILRAIGNLIAAAILVAIVCAVFWSAIFYLIGTPSAPTASLFELWSDGLNLEFLAH